jgi:predicted Zn finger-like uncharacterized protein
MRMSTRCPACGTAFRVYPQQLAARDGQVRCGKCATIFDARSTLATEDEPEAPPAAAPASPPVSTPVSTPSVPVSHTEALAQVEAVVAQPVVAAAPPEPEISVSDDDSDFEFGPRARRRSAVIAALWGLAALVMALALAGQLAYAYRGELALLVPESRPWLEAACARLRCTIPPPRHADLISIEASELAAERGVAGMLTLSAALRNRANFAQAFPHLELTLTDAADQPVARRVLAPREYLDAAAALRADAGSFAPGAEQPVKLHIDAAGLNASGYRIFLFYQR